MSRPERIENLEDVKMWIAEHDGRIDQLWANQKELNERNEARFESVHDRLTALEKRIVFVAGGASMIGSASGFILLRFLAGVG